MLEQLLWLQFYTHSQATRSPTIGYETEKQIKEDYLHLQFYDSGRMQITSSILRGNVKFFFSTLHSTGQRKIFINSTPVQSQAVQLGNVLLTASVVKTLSESGAYNLKSALIPLSESLVIQILKRNSLDPSKKLEFFKWCSQSPNYKHTALTYSEILRALCYSRNPNILCDREIRGLLDSMKADGVNVDSATFKLAMDAFILSGQYDSALKVLDHMEELGVSLNHQIYDSILLALVRKTQIESALSIFNKLLDTSNGNAVVPFKSLTCNELLVALRRAGMKEQFGRVFHCLRENKYVLDTWGYNICIHSFGCWGDLETSLLLFKEMKYQSSGSSSFSAPDLCTYNCLLQVLCLAGKARDALTIYEELKGSGHEPDAFTYRILIQGCSKSYRVEDATKIWHEMQYHGFQPDTIVYNSLLDGLLKARKVTEACQIFEKMIRDGIRASCWTYNILIDGLIRNGRSIAAYALFLDLKKKGRFVDGVTFSIIILYLCREGQLDEALELVEEMEGRGFMVDLVTLTSLLICIYKHRQFDSVERLMKYIRDGALLPTALKWKADMEASLKSPPSMRKDSTPMFPSKGEFGKILDSLRFSDPFAADRNFTDEDLPSNTENQHHIADGWSSSTHADELANQERSNDCIFFGFSLLRSKRVQDNGMASFDIDMMNTYLSIFLAKGKISLACKLFEIFTDMGRVNPTNYTYNSMMSSFVKKGYFDQAWAIIDHLGEKLYPADIATYNLIIQSLGKMGRADLASSVLKRLLEEGGYLDIVMYNTLINALGKAGRIDEARRLFEQMKSTGINPDTVTFNILTEVHTRAGMLKEAYKFLRMMLDAGCSPNHVTDTTLEYLGKEIEKLRYKRASIKRTEDNTSST